MLASLKLRYRPDTHSAEDRVAAWRAAMLPFGEPRVDPDEVEAFYGELCFYNFGTTLVAELQVSRHTLVRDQSLQNRTGLNHIALNLFTEGGFNGTHTGQPMEVFTGDGVMLDMGSTMSLAVQPCRCLALIMPRTLLDAKLGYTAAVVGTLFRAESVEARLLSETLETALRVAPDLSVSQAAGLGHTLIDVLANCLGPDMPSSVSDTRKPTALRLHRFIERNLARPDLDGALLCREFGLSRTTLYRMLERDGGVLSLIRRHRASYALQLLRTPAQPSLDTIASRAGFRDARALRRAMQETFGATPQQLRSGVLPMDKNAIRPHEIVSKWFDSI